MRICGTCRAWERDQAQCRRRPPVILPMTEEEGTVTLFPEIYEQDWCAAWIGRPWWFRLIAWAVRVRDWWRGRRKDRIRLEVTGWKNGEPEIRRAGELEIHRDDPR